MPEQKQSGHPRPLFFPYKSRLNIDIYIYFEHECAAMNGVPM